jgi:hypothetical protein
LTTHRREVSTSCPPSWPAPPDNAPCRCPARGVNPGRAAQTAGVEGSAIT